MVKFLVTKNCTWLNIAYDKDQIAEFFEGSEPFVYKKLGNGKVDKDTKLPHPYFEKVEE